MLTHDDVDRLAALEREVARLRLALQSGPRATACVPPRVLASLLAAAAVVVLAAGAVQDAKVPAKAGASAPDEAGIVELVRARRFVLVDESGRERLVLQTKKQTGGAGAVVVKNAGGRVLAAIGEDGQGQGRVQLYDPSRGIIRAELLIQNDGAAGILLRDRETAKSKGTTRATLWVRPDGTPEVTLRDAQSNVRVASIVPANGNALSVLRDPQGTSKVVISADADGTGGVRLFEGPENYRAGMTILPDGSPGVTLLNEQGTGGIQMTMEARGKRGGIVLRDGNGKDRARFTLTSEGPAVIQSISPRGNPEATWPPGIRRD